MTVVSTQLMLMNLLSSKALSSAYIVAITIVIDDGENFDNVSHRKTTKESHHVCLITLVVIVLLSCHPGNDIVEEEFNIL